MDPVLYLTTTNIKKLETQGLILAEFLETSLHLFACASCNRLLFNRFNVIVTKNKSIGTERIGWMKVTMGTPEGPIECPGCETTVGSYNVNYEDKKTGVLLWIAKMKKDKIIPTIISLASCLR
jgi:hypothetical protein